MSGLDAPDRVLSFKPVIDAEYVGPWEFPSGTIELWLLRQDIDGHPKGSSVSRTTILKAGFALPNIHVDRKALR